MTAQLPSGVPGGGVIDRVVKLSNGEYEVHDIGVNWPHHIFVNQDFKVLGADEAIPQQPAGPLVTSACEHKRGERRRALVSWPGGLATRQRAHELICGRLEVYLHEQPYLSATAPHAQIACLDRPLKGS